MKQLNLCNQFWPRQQQQLCVCATTYSLHVLSRSLNNCTYKIDTSKVDTLDLVQKVDNGGPQAVGNVKRISCWRQDARAHALVHKLGQALLP